MMFVNHFQLNKYFVQLTNNLKVETVVVEVLCNYLENYLEQKHKHKKEGEEQSQKHKYMIVRKHQI